MDIADIRRLWATANKEDPADPELAEILPDEVLEGLEGCDDDVVAAAAITAQARDDRRKLRPTAWTDAALRAGQGGSLRTLRARAHPRRVRSVP